MGLVLIFAGQQTAKTIVTGQVATSLTLTSTTGAQIPSPHISASFQLGIVTTPTTPVVSNRRVPDMQYEVAFASQPLAASPTWVDVSTRLRAVTSDRGRSYEFEREETGTSQVVLSNRDAALSPSNTASPYAPVKSTRPVRVRAIWLTPYPVFRGISEGFPQTYPALGKDSLVRLQANDLFYGLNNSRFTPGETTLAATLDGTTTGAQMITVGTTALPMPQSVPFTLMLGDNEEEVTVDAIFSATQYQVTRASTSEGLREHAVGTRVSASAVNFAEALSGERIRQVLEAVGFDSDWYDLDAGQSLIAPSEDLAAVSPLEHINLIADAEFGRFFVSREGKFTFRDRHSVILDYLTPVMTFGVDDVPFSLEGDLSHSEDKLFNRVKITIAGGAHDGTVVDISDQTSIDDHFERVYERTFPYANPNDADSAARFVLARNAEAALRLPGIVVKPAVDPGTLWPQVLARELGERVRFRYQPEAGGTAIDSQLIIEGISHDVRPLDHVVTFQCTEADPTQYWILGLAGYGELGETTRVAF